MTDVGDDLTKTAMSGGKTDDIVHKTADDFPIPVDRCESCV
jgi:hypothetical protein